MSKKPWIWSACRSTVSTRSVPTVEIIFAATFAVIGTRAERGRRSWRAYPKYGITAVTSVAEARLSASTSTSSSMKFAGVGAEVGCTTYTSCLLTFSSISTCTSPSENRPTIARPSRMPSSRQISCASGRLAFPAKTRMPSDLTCVFICGRLQPVPA